MQGKIRPGMLVYLLTDRENVYQVHDWQPKEDWCGLRTLSGEHVQTVKGHELTPLSRYEIERRLRRHLRRASAYASALDFSPA